VLLLESTASKELQNVSGPMRLKALPADTHKPGRFSDEGFLPNTLKAA